MTCFPQRCWHQPCCCRLCVCAEVPSEMPYSWRRSRRRRHVNLAEGTQLPPHTQPEPGAALDTNTGSACAFSHREHRNSSQRRGAFLQPQHSRCRWLVRAAAARCFAEEALGHCLQAGGRAAPQQPGLLTFRGLREPRSSAFPRSQGPYGSGGRRGSTCCSSYCFISTENSQAFGSEAFCLRWLWHFLDTHKKLQIIQLTSTIFFFPFPFNFVNASVHSPSQAHQIN